MSNPTACLLLGQYAPATARLFVELRRLRDNLPRAEARAFAERAEEPLWDVEMMTTVRLCGDDVYGVCQTCRAPFTLQSSFNLQSYGYECPRVLHLRMIKPGPAAWRCVTSVHDVYVQGA